MRRAMLWVGNGLIGLGLLAIVTAVGLRAYGLYEQSLFERTTIALLTPIPSSPTPIPSPSAVPTVGSTPAIWPTNAPREFVPWAERFSATPTLAPTATPREILPAQRIVAPTIHLDAPVVESPLVNGQWQIPKFAAGHLEGTAQPLQGSNVVLAGHVESISSGNVFANIHRLQPGDPVRLYTARTIVSYRVERILIVSNTDIGVIAPTPRETLTLITCAGAWLPLQHDYSERTVVVATGEK
jgi:sortase A